ncbi:hypothetical protein EON65_56525 [archaeon]|nr:MAG: hypothetical protein EON65_56525 [archaeon]
MSWQDGCLILQRDEEEIMTQLLNLNDMVCSRYYSRLIHLATSEKVDSTYLNDVLFHYHQLLWERMHSVTWKDVPDVYCGLFGLVTALLIILKADHLESKSIQDTKDFGDSVCNLQRLADLGILMGGKTYVLLLQQVLIRLKALNSQHIHLTHSYHEPSGNNLIRKQKIPKTKHATLRSPIAKVSTMSLQDFYEHYLLTDTPIVLTEAMQDWKALQTWHKVEYLQSVLGDRTVPVEMGASYLSPDYSASLMRGGDFIQHCLLTRDKQGYLAQHALLEQVAELQEDIVTPDFCCLLREEDGQTDEVLRNAWLGPCNTVSPLHYDCFHNLLAQVVGESCNPSPHTCHHASCSPVPFCVGCKFIRLYAPSCSHALRPMEGKMRNNRCPYIPLIYIRL